MDSEEAERLEKDSDRRPEDQLKSLTSDFVDQIKEFLAFLSGKREVIGDVWTEECHVLNYVNKESLWLLCGEETRRPSAEARDASGGSCDRSTGKSWLLDLEWP